MISIRSPAWRSVRRQIPRSLGRLNPANMEEPPMEINIGQDIPVFVKYTGSGMNTGLILMPTSSSSQGKPSDHQHFQGSGVGQPAYIDMIYSSHEEPENLELIGYQVVPVDQINRTVGTETSLPPPGPQSERPRCYIDRYCQTVRSPTSVTQSLCSEYAMSRCGQTAMHRDLELPKACRYSHITYL